MALSADVWGANADLYEKIRTHPFNEELAAGTLSQERFTHYIIQDAHYLEGFGRALAIIAAKAPAADEIIRFAKAAEEAIVVERALHHSYFAAFGISPEAFAATPMSPACHHYVSFLMASAWGEPYEVALAAVLPCFWIYAEVGRDILGRAASPNPFQAWIDTYAGEDFHTAVEGVVGAVDRAAQHASLTVLARMHAAYKASTRLEWMFWDSAYRLGAWEI